MEAKRQKHINEQYLKVLVGWLGLCLAPLTREELKKEIQELISERA